MTQRASERDSTDACHFRFSLSPDAIANLAADFTVSLRAANKALRADWLARELAANAANTAEEVSALLSAATGGELPATSEAGGIDGAWRTVVRDGHGEWLLTALERNGDRWEAPARHTSHGVAILVPGRSPAYALYRLAEVLRRT